MLLDKTDPNSYTVCSTDKQKKYTKRCQWKCTKHQCNAT